MIEITNEETKEKTRLKLEEFEVLKNNNVVYKGEMDLEIIWFYKSEYQAKIRMMLKASKTDKVNQVYALKETVEYLEASLAQDFFKNKNARVSHLYLKVVRLRNLYKILLKEGFSN